MPNRSLSVLISGALFCATPFALQAADWPTDGGNPQRQNWQQNEKILTPQNVGKLKLLWKLQLDNIPHEMHSLFPPLIADAVSTPLGTKQIAIEAGIDNNIYAIDVAAGKVIWKKHFDYPTPARAGRPGDPLCPTGQTATPVLAPGGILYALAGDGKIHTLNIVNGEDVNPPFAFGYPNGKSYSLNLWHDTLFTTTSQGCAGNPNQIWAVNLKDPEKKVMTASPKSGGLWGRQGAAIDSGGTAWAPTGDGRYDEPNHIYGNGIIGAKVEGSDLKIQDWYIPSNWIWLQKRDLDMQVTPAIFPFAGKELMVTGSKECRMFLLDTKSAGGTNHQTPLARTPLMCNEETDFQSAGIWGSMATWQDTANNRYVLTPFWGPVHPDFKPPIVNGPVEHGAIVSLKVEETAGKFALTPTWISRDMDQAEPPVVANGIVFAYGNGENTRQAYADKGLADYSPLRIKASTHAVLYALDAKTGKELYSSGDQIKSWNHFSGLTVANGRVYIATYDSMLYCFGLEGQQ